MNQEDIDRAAELERLFTSLYPEETPFSFSKTISKALEIAYESVTTSPESKRPEKPAPKISIQEKTQEKSRPSKFFGKRKH